MYHAWLDRWDEKKARLGDAGKEKTEFALGTAHCFPNQKNIKSIEEFCRLAELAAKDPTFFGEPDISDLDVEAGEGWVKFPSSIATDIEENNEVHAKVTKGHSRGQALVIFHHWNATKRYHQIARFFAQRGITVVEIALPYHFERSRPGASQADYFVSSNIGRTNQSVRQGVCDGRKLIRWLKAEGYGEISVLGISLGSWVAGLVAAHDPVVKKAALFLTAGSAADMVWTSRATRSIRSSLEPVIGLNNLRRAWIPMNLEYHADKLSRPDLQLQIVLAKRDKVVLPSLSKSLLCSLIKNGATPKILELNCGHYSLTRPPYNILAGLSLKRMLDR